MRVLGMGEISKQARLYVIVLAVLFVFSCQSPVQSDRPHAGSQELSFESFILGNSEDVVTSTSSGLMLMGGGSDVDPAFQWMISKSGGGDFLVLRASGSDAYNPYIYGMGGVDSVETIIIHSRTAVYNVFVLQKIRNAEALFIAGGNQADYCRYIKNSPLAGLINEQAKRGIPIGGTSAGEVVWGQFIFSAEMGTVYSEEALSDPYDLRVTLENEVFDIPVMRKTILDSHFAQRNRMGRLVCFLARIIEDNWSSEVNGIGIDEATALLIENDGTGSICGNGAVYFLKIPGPPQECQSGRPLTYRNITIYKAQKNSLFDLDSWTGTRGTEYNLSAESGKLMSSQTSIY
jgi:cyanophycinase